jgi:hypothetical protein
MSIIYSGKHTLLAVQQEVAFGTPIADGAAMIQLSSEPFIINPDVKHRIPNRAVGKLYRDLANVWNDSKGAVPGCSIKTVALREQLALWLYLAVQSVVEAATTPYQKTFAFPANGPDFSANAGCFVTVVSKSPTASTSQKLGSAICSQLVATLNAKNDDGNLALSANLLGKSFSRAANPSGTWTKTAEERFNFHDYNVCTLDGNAIILEDYKLTIDVGIVPVGGASGSFQNFAIISQAAKTEVTGIWETNIHGALTKLDSGALTEMILGWGTINTDGYLNLTSRGVIESGAFVEEDTRKVHFVMDGVSDVANTKNILDITLADAKDYAW